MEKLHIVLRAMTQPSSLLRSRLLMATGGLYQNKLIRFKSQLPTKGHQEMLCCQDGGRSQGNTRHSMPPARRQGGFNLDDQLIPPPRGDDGAQAITA